MKRLEDLYCPRPFLPSFFFLAMGELTRIRGVDPAESGETAVAAAAAAAAARLRAAAEAAASPAEEGASAADSAREGA